MSRFVNMSFDLYFLEHINIICQFLSIRLPVRLNHHVVPLSSFGVGWVGWAWLVPVNIPRRKMRSISSRRPIVFTYVLSPEGRCEAYPVGVQLFLLMFYFVLVNVLWKKKGHPSSVIFPEFFPRNVLFEIEGELSLWDGVSLSFSVEKTSCHFCGDIIHQKMWAQICGLYFSYFFI